MKTLVLTTALALGLAAPAFAQGFNFNINISDAIAAAEAADETTAPEVISTQSFDEAETSDDRLLIENTNSRLHAIGSAASASLGQF